MKKITAYLLLLTIFYACQKNEQPASESLNVSGIKTGSSSEIVNISLKSGQVKHSGIDCYLFASTLVDPNSSGFGYVDCNNSFNLVNLLTGELLHRYPLPGPMSQTVVDPAENVLIGQYYHNGTNLVVKLDLNTGEVLASNPVDFGDGILACTYYFNPISKKYVLLRADGSLISIDPASGELAHVVTLASHINNAEFDVQGNRLIGLTYSRQTDQNYIEVLDPETGALLSKAEVQERNDYFACASGFDRGDNSYILVNANKEVLFIDIQSGAIKDRYLLDYDIQEFKFWRGR